MLLRLTFLAGLLTLLYHYYTENVCVLKMNPLFYNAVFNGAPICLLLCVKTHEQVEIGTHAHAQRHVPMK